MTNKDLKISFFYSYFVILPKSMLILLFVFYKWVFTWNFYEDTVF